MGHSSVRIKVRRRKVAQLASYSRQHTVKNTTIPKADPKSVIDIEYPWGIVKGTKGGDWKIPEKGYPQPKNLRKRCKGQKWVKYKDGTVELKKWDYPSEFPNPQYYQKKLWKNLGQAEKMEAYVQEKIKKWDKKHPKPCPDDDLFREELIPAWEKSREEAVERIRDFVVSVYHKLRVVGNRVDKNSGKMVGKTVAEVKDIDQKGHNVNHPNLKESDKLYKKATHAATVAMNKDHTIVDCDLENHKGNQKRPLINAKRSKPKNLKEHRQYKKAA